MGVEISIEYLGNLNCSATHMISGNTITTDAPLDNAGKGESFSPTDLVAAALGTCIITVIDLVARHSGIELKGTRLKVVKEMTSIPSRRIGRISVEITYPKGLNLSETDRMKLERSAHMCPVKNSLAGDVEVELTFIYS